MAWDPKDICIIYRDWELGKGSNSLLVDFRGTKVSDCLGDLPSLLWFSIIHHNGFVVLAWGVGGCDAESVIAGL